MAKKIGYSLSACLEQKGLTHIGKVIVNWCLDNGVIIDLNHSNITSRNEVYAILKQRRDEGKTNVPISFTHTGVREIAAEYMSNKCDLEYLPDLEEIKLISCYKGIVGVILMNYWLVGVEEDDPTRIDNAIPHIIRTVECIHGSLGNYDTIAIGTDLDGFTQVPDDLRHVRLLSHLSDTLEKKFGVEVANKICYQNALRVLNAGWT
jgi:membrane dipeptidase